MVKKPVLIVFLNGFIVWVIVMVYIAA